MTPAGDCDISVTAKAIASSICENPPMTLRGIETKLKRLQRVVFIAVRISR